MNDNPYTKPSHLNVMRAKLAEIKTQREMLELEVRKGDLIRYSDVQSSLVKLFSTIKQSFLAMPTKLAPELASINDPMDVHRILASEVEHILRDLSKYEYAQPRESQQTDCLLCDRPGASTHNERE